MYTLETRYRPIPQKVLPIAAAAESHVLYHIEPKQSEQTSPTIIQHSQCQTLSVQNGLLFLFSLVKPDTPPPQAAEFLEPKIIPAPILYAIVAQKSYPSGMSDPCLSFFLANAVVSL